MTKKGSTVYNCANKIMYTLNPSFYVRVKEKIKGNWGVIFLASAIISMISTTLVFSGSIGEFATVFGDLQTYGSQYILQSSKIGRSSNFFGQIFPILIASILQLSLNIELISFLKTGKFQIVNLFRHIQENPKVVVICGAIMGLIQLVLSSIPAVGPFAYFVVSFMFIYVGFIVALKKDMEIQDYFKESINLTKGYKMQLFKVFLHYYLFVILFSISLLISVVLMTIGVTGGEIIILIVIGVILFFASAIGMLVISVRNTPLYLLANAMFFEEQLQHEGIEL